MRDAVIVENVPAKRFPLKLNRAAMGWLAGLTAFVPIPKDDSVVLRADQVNHFK